jgi:rod shape determining protein RodA
VSWAWSAHLHHRPLRRIQKVQRIPWILVLAICGTAGVGMVMLYSAAGGSAEPWAIKQLPRFVVALGIMLIVALSDIRIWLRWAYLIYFAALILLVIVEFFGDIGMGAQRWLDLGIINLQPSEVMKIALVPALARYFHGLDGDDVGRPAKLLLPAVMVLIPVGLVMKQPDLGTAMMLLLGGAAVFFAAGVRLWMFAVVMPRAANTDRRQVRGRVGADPLSGGRAAAHGARRFHAHAEAGSRDTRAPVNKSNQRGGEIGRDQ